jgi:hypothetical protein
LSDYHVSATIHLSTDVPSPKAGGVQSGYSPHHKFAHFDWIASGQHTYQDEDVHFPGETLFALMRFASWEHMQNKVQVEDRFEIREVDRVIGLGTIDSIP